MPVPDLGSGDVQIGVVAAGASFADTLQRDGTLPVPSLPHTLGFEVAGVVEAVGTEVHGVVPGMRVVAQLPYGGGYSSRVVVPSNAVRPIAHDISFDAALALLLTGSTSLLLLRHARVAPGETVVVPSALGGVGSLAVKIARQLGARVIASVGSEAKAAKALALGVEGVVIAQPGWADAVRDLTGGRGADVVLQSSGGEIGRESLRALAPLGRLTMFGADNVVRPEALSAEEVRSLTAQGQSVGGFALMRFAVDTRQQALEELGDWVRSGKLAIDIMRFPFDAVQDMHAALSARATVGKVVLEL